MSEKELDEIDHKILQLLQEDARMTNVELADRVGLSPAPCLRRVSALEKAGIVRKYVTLLNAAAVNLGVSVFVQVSLDRQVEPASGSGLVAYGFDARKLTGELHHGFGCRPTMTIDAHEAAERAMMRYEIVGDRADHRG